MASQVRHLRLEMYYRSVAMNFAIMGAALSVMLMVYTDFNILSCVGGVMFGLYMIGYTLWYWIGDRKDVVTCRWLSDVSQSYVLYFLIWSAMKSPSVWWIVFAQVSAIWALMQYLSKK